jgi:SAM-dependent methyltransferase
MTDQSAQRQAHWQNVYQTRAADSVSWYRPHLEVSLELLDLAGLSVESRLIDVGGGASSLVDDLLARGLRGISVLDVSAEALAIARRRLGERQHDVTWIAGDVLQAALPAGGFDFWHDRAVFHFLTDEADAAGYAAQAARAVRSGGHAIVGGFAPDGPEKCSGLPVARRSAEDIATLLGPAFRLVAKRAERHTTPAGAVQSFAYELLQRA